MDAVHESEQLGKEQLSLAQQVWGFYLESCVRCRKCGHRSITRDAAMDLSLDISGAPTLDGALEAFFAEEQLDRDNKVDCERCGKKRLSAKRFALGSLPRVLVCHLKRFDAFGRKIGRSVKYPEVVDVGRHLTDAQLARMQSRAGGRGSARAPTGRYRLFGVVVHDGSSQFGHYYAYVCPNVDTERWWLINDAQCSPARRSEALHQQAYILFFLQEQASPAHTTPRVHARLKGRSDDDDDEDEGEEEEDDDDKDGNGENGADGGKGWVRTSVGKGPGGAEEGTRAKGTRPRGKGDGGAPRGLLSSLSSAFHSLVGGDDGQAAAPGGHGRTMPPTRAAPSSPARVAASERGGGPRGEDRGRERTRSGRVSDRAWSSVGARAQTGVTRAVGSRPPRHDLRGRDLRAPVDAFDRSAIPPPRADAASDVNFPAYDAEALELEYEVTYDDTSAGTGARGGASGGRRGRGGGLRGDRRIGVAPGGDLEAGEGGQATAQRSEARVRLSVGKSGSGRSRPRCGTLTGPARRRLQGLGLVLLVAAAVVASLVGMGALSLP